jgi:hypothetical protein
MSLVNKMARVLSLRGDPEIRGADPNVTPVLELTPEVLGNTYSEENPQVTDFTFLSSLYSLYSGTSL